MANKNNEDPVKVFIYFNLHKRIWSIKALSGERKGLVIGHAQNILLSDVNPKVSQAGRERVLREKCKNVHAGLTGILRAVCSPCTINIPGINIIDKSLFELEALGLVEPSSINQISYNPYLKDCFFFSYNSLQTFVSARHAWFTPDRAVYVE